MSIVIDNIGQFKVFFDVVYDMSSELLELQLFPERMVCAVLSRGHDRFFRVEYNVDFFNNYSVTEFQSIVVFVEDLYKLLKSTNNTDVLMLEVNDPYLVAKIQSKNGNSRLFEFVLPSDFIDSPNPPSIDLPVGFEVDVSGLKQSVKDIGLIGSDLFTFIVNGENLTVATSDDVPTKYANQLPIDNDSSVDVSASFALDYISQMLKFDKINKRVNIKLGTNMPIIYSFNDEIMGVKVDGLIAPRIGEE